MTASYRLSDFTYVHTVVIGKVLNCRHQNLDVNAGTAQSHAIQKNSIQKKFRHMLREKINQLQKYRPHT